MLEAILYVYLNSPPALLSGNIHDTEDESKEEKKIKWVSQLSLFQSGIWFSDENQKTKVVITANQNEDKCQKSQWDQIDQIEFEFWKQIG